MNQKKVIFVNSRLSGGGSERVMTLLANEFANNNYEVYMILLRNKQNETYEIDKRINKYQIQNKGKNKIIMLINRLKEMKKKFNDIEPDVIISFMSDINIMTIIAGWKYRKRIIVSERANPNSADRSWINRKMEIMLYRYIKIVVTQTEYVKQYFNKYQLNNVVTIPNPINDKKNKISNTLKKDKIIAIGRLTKQKNFSMLIDAFKLYLEKYPKYYLEICGDGPLKEALSQQAKQLGIAEKIIFSGFVDNIETKISESKMYISTSIYEGISNAMLESMAIGIPVICTDCPVGGAAMVIVDHENGILIPINDINKLNESMIEVTQNEKLAQKLAKNAQKVTVKYSLSKITKEWEKICWSDLND